MGQPRRATTAPAGRFLTVLALLVGLLAMHGLSTPRPSAVHAAPSPAVTSPAVPAPERHAGVHAPAPATGPDAPADARANHPALGHTLLAGCVLALTGLAVVLGLRRAAPARDAAPRHGSALDGPSPRRTTGRHPPPARPRVSLCVLRV